jgi:hypothetical protein
MAKTRLAAGADRPVKRGAKAPHEWDHLMQKAIVRAEKLGDQRRLRQLRRALQEGRSAQCLKRMSIITEADIDRELSVPRT